MDERSDISVRNPAPNPALKRLAQTTPSTRSVYCIELRLRLSCPARILRLEDLAL